MDFRPSTITRRVAVLQRAVGIVLVVLAAGPAYATVLAAAAATFQPIGMEFGEATMYGATLRILQGQPLYQPFDVPPFTVVPYTPLFYYAAAGLRAVFGEGFLPGRILSLAAGLSTAGLIAVIAAHSVRSVWLGALSALLFLGLAFPGGAPWLGLYRVDMLGVALSLGAVAALRLRRAIVLAGILAGLALLTKQTLFAASLAGVIWLWPSRRAAATYLGLAAIVVLVPCLVLDITTRGALVENAVLANVNPFDLTVARTLFTQMAAAEWLPLLLALVYVASRPTERLLVIYWLATSLQLIGMAKVGANHNYWIEFAAATAVLAAFGTATLLKSRLAAAAAPTLVVVFGVVLGSGLVHITLGGVGSVHRTVTEVGDQMAMLRAGSQDSGFDALVRRVHDEPGFVLADPPDVVVLANRPVMFEPLIFSMLQDEGTWHAELAVKMICDGSVRLLVLNYPLGPQNNGTFGRFHAWPDMVWHALEDALQPAGEQANREIYIARQQVDPACGSGA